MTRLIVSILLAAWSLHAAPASAAGAMANACAVLSDAEAARLAGAPLGEVARHGVKPTGDNGNDRESSCGHFPKGYHIETAEGPPDSGILVELHTFGNADEAKRFYEGVLGMHTQMQKAPGGAGPGSNVMPVSGVGEGAYLLPAVLPNSASKITTLTFLKGDVVASVQVWKNSAPVEAIACAAATQILARLP